MAEDKAELGVCAACQLYPSLSVLPSVQSIFSSPRASFIRNIIRPARLPHLAFFSQINPLPKYQFNPFHKSIQKPNFSSINNNLNNCSPINNNFKQITIYRAFTLLRFMKANNGDLNPGLKKDRRVRSITLQCFLSIDFT